MVILLSLMAVGMAIGYLLNRRQRVISVAGKLLTVSVYALLLILGLSIGRNQELLDNLPSLGAISVLYGALATAGSALLGWLFWKLINKKRHARRAE